MVTVPLYSPINPFRLTRKCARRSNASLASSKSSPPPQPSNS